MIRVAIVALAVAVAGCSWPFGPSEFRCADTHHFTLPDSMPAVDIPTALTDTTVSGVEPDSVVTTWSVDGECSE